MPLYEYQCESCNHRFEVIQKFSDPSPTVCPVCGKGPVRQLLSSPALQFKGSGWYITDYAKKGKTESAEPAKTGEKKPDAASSSATTKTDAPASTTTPTTPSKD